MRIEITDKCNLKCKYCHVADYKKNTTISDEVLESIKNKFPDKNTFNFSGGEVFTEFDTLIKVIKFLTSENSYIKIQTNATLITQTHCAILKKLNRNIHFKVSLDSHIEEHHNKLRGMYKDTIRGIKLLITNGFNVATTMVVTKINMNDIDGYIKFCKNLGITGTTIRRGLSNIPEALSNEESALVRRKVTILQTKNELKHYVDMKGFETEFEEKYPNCMRFNTNGVYFCSGKFSILADGTVNPCGAVHIPVGNIITDNLSDMKKSAGWDKVRKAPICAATLSLAGRLK